jgi:hypothetical protein
VALVEDVWVDITASTFPAAPLIAYYCSFMFLCLVDPVFPKLFKLVRLGILYELCFNSFSLKFKGLYGSSNTAVVCCTDRLKFLRSFDKEQLWGNTRLRSYTNAS